MPPVRATTAQKTIMLFQPKRSVYAAMPYAEAALPR